MSPETDFFEIIIIDVCTILFAYYYIVLVFAPDLLCGPVKHVSNFQSIKFKKKKLNQNGIFFSISKKGNWFDLNSNKSGIS